MPKLNRKLTWHDKLTIFSIILLSFTGISVAKLGKAMVTPFHLLMGALIGLGILYVKKSGRTVLMALFVLMMYMIFVNVYNFRNIRFTSILYTVIYCIEIMIVYNLIKEKPPDLLRRSFELVVYLYFFNVALGFGMSLVGLKIPILQEIIRVYYMDDGGARPMGWSSEPSYAAFIVTISYLAFIHMYEHKWDIVTMKVTGAYLVGSILMKTAFGMLFIVMVLIDWSMALYLKSGRGIRLLYPFLGIITIVGGGYIFTTSDNESISRLNEVSEILFDPFDTTQKKMAKLQEKDGSAFARIGPTFMLIAEGGDLDFNVYFGAGAGVAGVFLKNFLAGVLIDDDEVESLNVGIIPAFFIDYGIIGFTLLIIFLYLTMYNLPISFWLCYLLVMPNANVNTQLLWFGIAACLAVSMYKSRRPVSSIPSQNLDYEKITVPS